MDPANCNFDIVPKENKHLSACIECKLILNDSQWQKFREICPNC